MKQKLLLIFMIFTAILLTSAPFIFGAMDSPPKMAYLGTHFINSTDTFAYYGLYTQVKHKKITFFNPYTPEKHGPIFFRPTFSMALPMLKIIPLTSIQAYHFSRILLGILFLLILFHFLGAFFSEQAHRFYAFTLVIFGSGIGWLAVNFIKDPMDLWVPETNVFLSLMESPHFQFSLTLILLIFLFWIKNTIKLSIKHTIGASSLAFILFFCHPFDAPLIYLTLFIYSILLVLLKNNISKKKLFLCLTIFFIISSIPLMRQLYLTKINLIAKHWSKQNINISPSPLGFIYGLGLWFPFGILGIIYSLKNRDYKFTFLSSWAISYLFLIYIPINIQRRFLEGLLVPYILLSCYFIFNIFKKYYSLNENNGKLIFISMFVPLLFFSSFSNLFLLKRDFIKLKHNKTLPYYVDKDIVLGLKWLQSYDPLKKIILANWDISYLLPTYVYGQVLWGHKVQTIELMQKKNEINNYFNNNLSKDERKSFYTKYDINYLIWHLTDKNKLFKPDHDIYLKKVFKNKKVLIYKFSGLSSQLSVLSFSDRQ